MYVDTHCHLNHEEFAVDWVAVRARALAADVTRLLCIGYDEASSRRAVQLAQSEPGLFAAIGLHPDAGAAWDDSAQARLRALYHDNQALIAAYGEIGLDYHWDTLPRARQQDVFGAQIAFAASLAPTLPLVIHCREAQNDAHRTAQSDILSLLRESETAAPLVMHCFTGDWESAQVCLDAGCFLGIGGVVTFKKSEALREAVARLAPCPPSRRRLPMRGALPCKPSPTPPLPTPWRCSAWRRSLSEGIVYPFRRLSQRVPTTEQIRPSSVCRKKA